MSIRPARGLLLGIAFVVVPLCTLVGVDETRARFWLIGLIIALALTGIDALRGKRAAHLWSVSGPEQVRLFQNRAAEIGFTIHNRASTPRRAEIHIEFPRDVECPDDVITVHLAGEVLASVQCTAVQRGEVKIPCASVRISSPWALWDVVFSYPLSTSLRVYPDLRAEREAHFLIARQSLGQHRFRQIGKGREFEKLREYSPGDSFEDIHWKATARRRKPVVKVFQIERTQEVYAVIDSSRLSARGDLMDRYVSAALMLARAAEAQHDRFGLVSFSAGLDHFVPAASGALHFGRCRDTIFALQARPVTPDLEEVFSGLRARLHKRSLIVFLTALDDPAMAEAFTRDVPVLSKSHIVLVNVPDQKTARPLFAGPAPGDLDAVYSRLAGHLDWTALQQLRRTLKHLNVSLAITDPASLPAQLALQYLAVKQRQLL